MPELDSLDYKEVRKQTPKIQNGTQKQKTQQETYWKLGGVGYRDPPNPSKDKLGQLPSPRLPGPGLLPKSRTKIMEV